MFPSNPKVLQSLEPVLIFFLLFIDDLATTVNRIQFFANYTISSITALLATQTPTSTMTAPTIKLYLMLWKPLPSISLKFCRIFPHLFYLLSDLGWIGTTSLLGLSIRSLLCWSSYIPHFSCHAARKAGFLSHTRSFFHSSLSATFSGSVSMPSESQPYQVSVNWFRISIFQSFFSRTPKLKYSNPEFLQPLTIVLSSKAEWMNWPLCECSHTFSLYYS